MINLKDEIEVTHVRVYDEEQGIKFSYIKEVSKNYCSEAGFRCDCDGCVNSRAQYQRNSKNRRDAYKIALEESIPESVRKAKKDAKEWFERHKNHSFDGHVPSKEFLQAKKDAEEFIQMNDRIKDESV